LLALVVVVDGFLQVVADADVINDEAFFLRRAGHAVHARDGLQQVVSDDHFVQVHHLLDGCVEAGEQHVVHDHDADLAGHPLVLGIEGQLEALDRARVATAVGVCLDVRQVVVAAGDHYGKCSRTILRSVAKASCRKGQHRVTIAPCWTLT
jgi:hypothetical protein